MYEDIAWENFEKTGSLESFLEYKEMLKVKENINSDDLVNYENSNNKELNKLEGVNFNEFNKSKSNSNKRGNL